MYNIYRFVQKSCFVLWTKQTEYTTIFTIKEHLKIRKLIHSKLHFLPIVKHYTLQLILAKNLSINIDIDFFVQGLIFLVVFGFILVLQFVCMLIHRFTTLCHFIGVHYTDVDKSTVFQFR